MYLIIGDTDEKIRNQKSLVELPVVEFREQSGEGHYQVLAVLVRVTVSEELQAANDREERAQ